MYQQFFLLFAVIITGFALRKSGIIDDAMNNGLNRFVVYFAYPCLIILNIGTLEIRGNLLRDFLWMLGLTLFFFALYSALAFGYGKLRKYPRESANVVELAMVSPNNGFMGLPVALLFLGEQGLLLMIAHNAAMNLYFFSYGLISLRRNNPRKGGISAAAAAGELVKLLLNPNILSLFIGMALCLNRVALPGAAASYLEMIGSVATPMAMIFIGSTLTGCRFSEIVKDLVTVEASLWRLLVFPALTFLLVWFLPLPPVMTAALVLGASFPGAATVPMLAEQEGQDQEAASKIVFLSTVFSMATLPVVMKILSILILS